MGMEIILKYQRNSRLAAVTKENQGDGAGQFTVSKTAVKLGNGS